MIEVRGKFEWHWYSNEIVTCFLDDAGKRTGVSYIFTFESDIAAKHAWDTITDPMVLVQQGWESEQRKAIKAEMKLYRKLKKKYENVNADSTTSGAVE